MELKLVEKLVSVLVAVGFVELTEPGNKKNQQNVRAITGRVPTEIHKHNSMIFP